LEKGLVIKSTGSRYKVLFGEELIAECTIKGKLRVKETQTTNPIAVGDIVFFEKRDCRFEIKQLNMR